MSVRIAINLRNGDTLFYLEQLAEKTPLGNFSCSIAAYMSLIADAIKLSVSEKEIHNLNYPFKTIPAMKIAKLAVSQTVQEKYTGRRREVA